MRSDDAVARSRRRAAARAHHPDLGGDPDEFVRVMSRLGDGPTPARDTGPRITGPVSVRTTRRRHLARTLHRVAREMGTAFRGRLPRSVPGSRRYVRL